MSYITEGAKEPSSFQKALYQQKSSGSHDNKINDNSVAIIAHDDNTEKYTVSFQPTSGY